MKNYTLGFTCDNDVVEIVLLVIPESFSKRFVYCDETEIRLNLFVEMLNEDIVTTNDLIIKAAFEFSSLSNTTINVNDISKMLRENVPDNFLEKMKELSSNVEAISEKINQASGNSLKNLYRSELSSYYTKFYNVINLC